MDQGVTNKRLADLLTQDTLQKAAADKLHQSQSENNISAPKARQHRSIDPEQRHEDDDDDEIYKIREMRIREMKEAARRTREAKEHGSGCYDEVLEADFLKAVTSSYKVLCHFYHDEFETCKVLHKHLTALAPKHPLTRMIKVNAEKTPFFVSKLQIRTLPTMVYFVDGVGQRKFLGFQDFEGGKESSTREVAEALKERGVIEEHLDDEY